MSSESKLKLVVVGQVPPPFNGQAKMIEVMLRGLETRLDVRFVHMGFSDSISSAGKFSFAKIGHLLGLVFRTQKALGLRRNRYLYYPPASPNLVPVLRDIILLLLVRPFCKGVVLQFHAGGVSRFAAQHVLLRPFMRLAYGRMALGIVNGKSCPDDPGYFKARKTAVVPHGIEIPVSASDPRPLNKIFRILYVGIHTEEKGLFTLLETARVLKVRNVDFEICTVGCWYTEEEERTFLRKRTEYGLESQVCCVGRKTGADLWQEYARADVLCFPTKYPWETMGIVQLEAMAYGLPVVASDWPGPRDVVVDGKTGFLCPHDQSEIFAERLKQLAENDERRLEMGNAGRERYESMYTVEHYMNRLDEAFKWLVD